MNIFYRFLFFLLLIAVFGCEQSDNKKAPVVKQEEDKGLVLVVPKDAFVFEEMVYRESEDGIDTLNYISIDIKTGQPYCFVAKDLPLGMRVSTMVNSGTYKSTFFSIEYYDFKDVKFKTPFAEQSNYNDLRAKNTHANKNPSEVSEFLYGNFGTIPGLPAGGNNAYDFTYIGGGEDAYLGPDSYDWDGYELFSGFLRNLYKGKKTWYRQVISDGRNTTVKTRAL